MGKRINLKIEQGATFQHEFIWQDADTYVPVDLTGWTARMQVRKTLESASAEVDIDSDTGGITMTPAEGKVLVEITAAVTAGLDIFEGVYDLELEETASGFVERLAYGSVTISGEVTR